MHEAWRLQGCIQYTCNAAVVCVCAVVLVAHGLPLQPRIHQMHVAADDSEGGDGDDDGTGEEVVLAAEGSLLAPTALPRKGAAPAEPAVGIGADNLGLPVATPRCDRLLRARPPLEVSTAAVVSPHRCWVTGPNRMAQLWCCLSKFQQCYPNNSN